MNKDEIKASIPFPQIVRRYGYVPQRGFITCPFHEGDHTPSFQVKPTYGRCFACGWRGDIFAFVMDMDHVGFKEALEALGGDPHARSRDWEMTRYRAERDKQILAERRKATRREWLDSLDRMKFGKALADLFEPFSDPWCEAMEDYCKASAITSMLEEELDENHS